ncbi:hypothetical protein SAPIO_CDS4724 [Scedosporium apiospermum]|uniref:Uncharacterized protein n=1 Tax=Pseudallescheria apiosperma TaxID=563466 RepID=A0A084G7H1_PSEDA|nr:uncharacterized protein SAPIO_CDS4724 [Scedosporium apiospermum]KEZ43283.1 hypothetical protein SAPIO_CDS4724 [Scedosporium apiospermum]
MANHVPSSLPLIAPMALEFEEFSCMGADGSIRLRNISEDDRRALDIYLSGHFNVAIVDYSEPRVGSWGVAQIEDPAIVEALKERTIPPDDVILFLADHVFPDCEALSFMWKALVVELPKTSDEEFAARFESCPGRIEGVDQFLQYHNGPLPNMERRRRIASPNGAVLDKLVADKTDYL